MNTTIGVDMLKKVIQAPPALGKGECLASQLNGPAL